MAKTRRVYTGNAVAATIAGGLTVGSTSCVISSNTGWPATAPFYCVIDPGLSSEEKILVTAISGTTLTTITRGRDDTSDQGHNAGCTIYPVFTAVDADEANELASKWTVKGDLVTHGASTFATVSVGSNGAVLVADSTQTNGLKWGTVDTVGITDSAVTSAKIADGTIVSGDLADNAVIAAKIADGAVTSAKILDGTIVDADINASAAIADTKLATIATANKVSAPALNIVGATAIGSDLVDADSIVVYDDSATANRNTALSRFAKFLFSKVSGDITITDAGVATIGSTKVGTTNIVDGAVTSAKLGPLTVNSQTGTSYALVLADANRMIEMSNSSAITLTIPTNALVAFPTGTNITVMQTGAGQITVGGAGVTLRTAVALKSRAQWSALTLYKRGTDEWVVFGDTAA